MIIACLFVALVLADAASAPVPRWPLDLPTRYLTSNFMERRPGRWHAGLDLKTQTVTGFPVRAAEDGWVSRVRAESGAYGRVVYLRGESGKTYVYAHLERFADVLQERVDADRRRHGRYRVRLTLEPDEVPVRAGQVLALTGQSGTAGPHLHFEVRDASQRPLNPLEHGFALPDTFAPTIQAVTAHPVQPWSRVAGAGVPRTHRGKQLRGELPPLRIWGPVAFSASIVDRADVRSHRLEPWLIEVRLDGQLVYRRRNESFAFSENGQQRLEWCEIRTRDAGVRFREQWLHRRAEVDIPGREGVEWFHGYAGAGLAAGAHLLEILAEDRSGGRARVTVPLEVAPAPVADAGAWREAPAQIPVSEGRLTPFFAEAASGTAVAVRELAPERGDPVLAPTQLWLRTVPRRDWPEGWDSPPGLAPTSDALEVVAADWTVDGGLEVVLPGGEDLDPDPRLWVFGRGRSGWLAVGPLRDDGTFVTHGAGFHAAFLDTTPPAVAGGRLTVERGPASQVEGVTLPRWRAVAVGIGDKGTGVDLATVKARLDGEALIVEPDLPRSRLLVTVPDATEPGRHLLELDLSDRAGNPAAVAIDVLCR